MCLPSADRCHTTILNMDRLRLINVLFDQNELSLDLLDLSSLPGYHAMFRLEPAYRKRHQFNSRLRLKPTEVATAIGFVDQLEDELQRRAPWVPVHGDRDVHAAGGLFVALLQPVEQRRFSGAVAHRQ